MERFTENMIYASRWLLVPVYIGLSFGLLALSIKFFQELFHLLQSLFFIIENDLVVILLSLVDMTLVGGLLIMVMLSGYENFISKLDLDKKKEKLNWLGKMDSGSLKNKVAVSIVAISSIHLLRIFMETRTIQNDKIILYVIIHLTFVGSAFAMGLLDIMSRIKKWNIQ